MEATTRGSHHHSTCPQHEEKMHIYMLGAAHLSPIGAHFPAAAIPAAVQFRSWTNLTPAEQQSATTDPSPFAYWGGLGNATSRTWMLGYGAAGNSLGLFGHIRLFSAGSIPAPPDNLNNRTNMQGNVLLTAGVPRLIEPGSFN